MTTQQVTETVAYPLWERSIRVEPTVRTIAECLSDARRSWSAVSAFLDARHITGTLDPFKTLEHALVQPWRRDRERLRHRLRSESQRRHATHQSAATSTTPDLIAGRGGLLDLHALRWLSTGDERRIHIALDFLLRAISAAEELGGATPYRLSERLQERIAAALHYPSGVDQLAFDIAKHARWIAFSLDGALAPTRDDRQLGPSLNLRDGHLAADRLPPIGRAPSLGLRVANLVGLAPPADALMEWASTPVDSIRWDDAALEQFWLLLRAADWRAWEFLDVTGLLVAYLPELAVIRRTRRPAAVEDQAVDSHSFLALRRLHEWTDANEPLAGRAWRALRRRDGVYLAVLLHELSPANARAASHRLGLSDEVSDAIAFAVEHRQLVMDTATRRDLYDEELVLQLATRIGNRRRLSTLFLVAIAHELASPSSAAHGWQTDLVRQLYARLEAVLHQSGEVGARRTRSLEHHRERIVRELNARGLSDLESIVPRLPRRYVLARTPAFIARHLSLLRGAGLGEDEVRLQAHPHRGRTRWDVQIAALDRPGLLATMAGVFAMRGVSVLAADAGTTSDGLALDVFTVTGVHGVQLDREYFSSISEDVRASLAGRLPLADLLGARPLPADVADAIQVNVDNAASQFFSVIEVRAPDEVGLLYRIAQALHECGLDIHHAKIATHPDGAFDVFYVRTPAGDKLDAEAVDATASQIAAQLRGLR